MATGYTRYGDLKNDVAEALSELLRPVRDRRADLEGDPAHVHAVLAEGAAKAPRRRGQDVRQGGQRRLGLLPPTA